MQIGELQSFIEATKAKGASDEFLVGMLTRRGWPADDVYAALAGYWESAAGVPVPAHRPAAESARDAFLYLLSFFTLGAWAMALGSILFELINHWLPDPVSRGNLGYDLRSQLSWQMASMVVAFPIYILVTRKIAREANEHPDRLQSGVRKWLTYIALLITAGTMIGDLICFLDYFLTGEITARFVLKVLTVLAISGSIFAYYIGWLRGNRSRGKAFAISAAVAVAATFCFGLAVAGMPPRQRELEADRTRVRDLRNLAIAIKIAHDSGGSLPPSLEELRTRRSDLRVADPVTGLPYEYRVGGSSSYELWAKFAANSAEDRLPTSYAPETFWSHRKGRQCFQLDVQKVAPW